MSRRLRDSRGFTLVEVMVATSLLAIVMLIVYNTLNGGVRHAADVQSRLQIEADSRVAADAFVRDLRQAYTGDASGTLTRVASGMTGTTVTFYSPDRATPYHLRKISYRLTGTTLERSVTVSSDADGAPWLFGTTGPYVPVLQNVRNTTLFTYFDQDGVATTAPTDISTVTLSLTIDKDPTRQPGAVSYTTTVNLRGDG